MDVMRIPTPLMMFRLSSSDLGGGDEQLKRKFPILITDVLRGVWFSGLADSVRATYKMARSERGSFCFVRNTSVRLEPGAPGRDGPILDYFVWAIEVLGRKESTLRARFSAIRFMRLINGDVDFPPHAHMDNAPIKGARQREGTVRKRRFNTDPPRWINIILICK